MKLDTEKLVVFVGLDVCKSAYEAWMPLIPQEEISRDGGVAGYSEHSPEDACQQFVKVLEMLGVDTDHTVIEYVYAEEV